MSVSWSKRAFAGALGAAAIAGAAVAGNLVSAQTPSPTPSAQATATPAARQQLQQRVDEFLARLAQNLGVDVTRLRDALKQTALQEVDRALAEGRLTAQQAQQARDRINAGDIGPFGFGLGHRGFGGPGGHRGPGGAGVFAQHDQIAQFLGMTAEQLRTALATQSLAQVAQAQGKTADQLKQFIVTTAQQSLASAVSAGRMTQQQADQALASLQSNLDAKINAVGKGGLRGWPRIPRMAPAQ